LVTQKGADHFRALSRFQPMPYVQSSALERVTYDEETHTLCATFRETHRTFMYEEVPQEIYDGLIFADSLGGYFNAHIRGHFPYREIREN
jgi:hypothetical protein